MNIALNKTATQSGVKTTEECGTHKPELAVDGQNFKDNGNCTCAYVTTDPDGVRWWAVDFGEKYKVDQIVVHTRRTIYRQFLQLSIILMFFLKVSIILKIFMKVLIILNKFLQLKNF